MRMRIAFILTFSLLLGACSSTPSSTPMLENIAVKSFRTPAKNLPSTAASQVEQAAPTQSSTPGVTPEPIRTAAPGATPQPSTTLEPAPEGYISRDYYSIQLPPGYLDFNEVEWASGDGEFVYVFLGGSGLPSWLTENIEDGGSFDLFADHTEFQESNGGLIEIIVPRETGVLTIQEFAAGNGQATILSEGKFVTESGAVGSGGIIETDWGAWRFRTGFLGFQEQGHSYYLILTTSVGSFEELEDNLESALKSIVFYAGPESPRPFATKVPPEVLHVVSFAPEPYDLDPIWQNGSADEYVGAIYAGLVRLSPELEVVPDLAESWDISAGGAQYSFMLRDGLAFENGKPLTTADIVYSWERAADPDWGSRTARTYLGDIQGVKDKLDGKAGHISGLEVIDERRLRVTLDRPHPDFLFKLTYPTSYVVDQETVRNGDWFQPNASGPYSIYAYDDDSMRLMRNESYHTPAAIDVIEYSYYDNLATFMLYSYFEYEDFDLTALLDVDEIVEILQANHPGHDSLVTGADQCTDLLDMNPNLPPLDDINVRKAFALAIDRDRLNEELYTGLDLPAFTVLPPGMPGYSEKLAEGQAAQAEFGPEAAASALAASPYADDLPEIRMLSELDEYSSGLLRSMWEETLGVRVSVDESYDVELTENEINESYHLRLHGWCADYPDPANFLDILYAGQSDYNGFDLQASDFREQLAEARSLLDHDQRLSLYQDAERRLLQEFFTVPLLHSRTYFLVSKKINGFIYPGIDVRYLDQLTLIK